MFSADNDYSDLQRKYKKTLVAEQPGFVISMVGILLAIFLGIVVRASFSSDKVLYLIDKAAAKLDKRMSAKVGSASISLSDGIFPEISVVVKDVVISSEETCWMRPHLEVDELRLPISIFHLLQGEVRIHQVYAHDVALTLRATLSECQNRKPSQQDEAGSAKNNPSVQLNEMPDNLASDIREISSAGGQIDEMNIQNLHIHYLPIAFTTIRIRDFNIQVVSADPKTIKSSGILHLAGETLSGDYSSTAKVNVDYSEENKTKWNFAMSGQWREGHYDLLAEYLPKNQNIEMSLDMAHIPLSQLFPLLRKYHILHSDFNGKQIWLTMKADAHGKASNLQSLPVQVQKLRIEGNIGEIESKNIQIQSLEPFQYQPIDIDIRALNLEELFVFLNRPHPSQTIGKLGTLHGKATFGRNGDVSLIGDLSGLEFIFSNRGSRQVQSLSLISGSVLFKQNKWNAKIDRIKPAEGVFLGSMNIDADHNWKNINLRTRVDDLTFSPAVQKLMTGGGELGSLSADVAAQFRDGELKNLNGQLNTSEMQMDQMNIRSSRFQVSTRDNLIYLDTKIQGLYLAEASPAYQLFSRYLDPKMTEKGIKVQSLATRLKSHFLNDLAFENMQMKLSEGQIEIHGGWDQSGQLFGQMKVHSTSKHSRYEISGHRDQPMLTFKK